jgi:hypothetical protein
MHKYNKPSPKVEKTITIYPKKNENEKTLRCKASYLDLLPHFHLETLTPINLMLPLH